MLLRTIVESQPGLQELISVKFPVKTSYRVKKLVDLFNKELKVFTEVRQELFEKYGEMVKDENRINTGEMRIKDEYLDKYTREINELLDTEIEVNFTSLKISELGDVSITPMSLVLLDWLIEDEGE